MGFTTAISYIKKNFTKHMEKEDQNQLPLHGQINGVIKLPENIFVHTLINGQLIEKPMEKEQIIKAIGKLTFDHLEQLKIHKYYIDVTPGNEKFIQIVEDPSGNILETYYASEFNSIIPETQETIDIFLGNNENGVGVGTFNLGADMLEKFNEKQLTTFFGEQETIEYHRDSTEPEDVFVSPYKGKEIVRTDHTDQTKGFEKEITFMPYYRKLENDQEFLWFSTEYTTNVNHDATKNNLYVKMFFAVKIDANSIGVF